MNCNDIIELEILEDETNMELDVEFKGDIIRLGGGEFIETDPTVPEWAKQPKKPTYTAEEVGALDSDSMTTILTGFVKIDKLFEDVASANQKLKLSSFTTVNLKSDDGTLPAGKYYGISHTNSNITCIKIGTQEIYNISKNTTYNGETYITTYKVKKINNNSFINAGVFNAIGEIKYNYNWEENVLYHFKISDKFDDLPTGTYLGIYYNDSDFDSDILEFTPFTPDGKSRIFNFNTLEIYIDDLTGISDWAKQPEKPTYTAKEVGALSMNSVNQVYNANSTMPQSGTAVAQAIDNIEFPTVDQIYNSNSENAQSGKAIKEAINEKFGDINEGFDDLVSFVEEELDNKADKSAIPKVDQIFNKTSNNPQSGVAIEAYLQTAGITGDRKVFEDLSKYYMPDNGYNGLENYLVYNYRTDINVGTRMTLAELKSLMIGDIDTALDELHAYAQNLVSGGATE